MTLGYRDGYRHDARDEKGAVLSAADVGSTARAPVEGVLDLAEARTLFDAGRLAGKLDAEEIALALDELDLDAAQLDEFYSALEDAQVEVVAVDRATEESEKEWEVEAEISTDTLQLFLKDIGKVPLLTAAQEVELAKRIEAGLYAQHLLATKKPLGESVGASSFWQVICAAQALRTRQLPPMPHTGESQDSLQASRAIVYVCGLNQQVTGLSLILPSSAFVPAAKRPL